LGLCIVVELSELKAAILKLLKEDEEFRYAVAGLIGLEEILRRLDSHGEELVRLREEMMKLREDMLRIVEWLKRHDELFAEVFKRLDRHEEELVKIGEELVKLREDMNKRFEHYDQLFAEVFKRLDRHDELFAEVFKRLDRHDELFAEVFKRLDRHDELFAEVFKRLDRHEEELVRLREDMNKRFEHYDQLFAEVFKRLDRHEEELVRLRVDMTKGFELVQRHLDALGARWGLLTEEAFREGLRGLLERELSLRVEKWRTYDSEGKVFGYPSEVEIDIAVKDSKVILIEITSHTRTSDVYILKKKAELYTEKEGRRPDRLIIVTPYAEEKAMEAAMKLGVELYTKL